MQTLRDDYQFEQNNEPLLLSKVQAGDFVALEELYQLYSRQAFGLALRIIGNYEAAEDVVQEVFVRFRKQPSSYNPARGRFVTWLLSVVRNACIDQLRRKNQHHLSLDFAEADGQLNQLAAGRTSVEEEVWLKVQREAIRLALQKLPPEQAQMVDLAFFKGLPHQEIAITTGQPLGTVKSRTRQGLLKLKDLLAHVAVEPGN